ncbi:hypothetical protein FNYG_04394 [Fusarium nygamai]|uniref:Heterokaryon incompatibility domain-containing protein n=1 Tax=Gibberella nygamai TaxID=42673 RepID=A0A2K0WIZ5_GIBNY|nr:hypothetical protein FNYG_04394 [Fusarium nygamai]
MLKLDIRNTDVRNYSFDVTVDKECTEIRLGLKDNKYALSQLAGTYYQSAGGIPDAIFDMIRDWLRQCQADHQTCRNDSTTHIPTRLVDVRTLESSTVHLVETGNGFHAPYLTLSHCWGQNANIIRRTTAGNLEIPFKNLPRTFRDAITVTRKLGFMYLWIDSLCIIQGDKADWERESSIMASIYSNGILNLAASYSSDSHGGLFLERNQHHVTSCSWRQQIEPVSSRNPSGEWMQSRQASEGPCHSPAEVGCCRRMSSHRGQFTFSQGKSSGNAVSCQLKNQSTVDKLGNLNSSGGNLPRPRRQSQ